MRGLTPAGKQGCSLLGRDIDSVPGTIELAPTAQRTVFRILDNGLASRAIDSEHIHRTTFNAYSAAGAKFPIDTFNSQINYLLTARKTDSIPVERPPYQSKKMPPIPYAPGKDISFYPG